MNVISHILIIASPHVNHTTKSLVHTTRFSARFVSRRQVLQVANKSPNWQLIDSRQSLCVNSSKTSEARQRVPDASQTKSDFQPAENVVIVGYNSNQLQPIAAQDRVYVVRMGNTNSAFIKLTGLGLGLDK